MYDVVAGVVVCKILSEIHLLGVAIGVGLGVFITTQHPHMALVAQRGTEAAMRWTRDAMRRLNEASKDMSVKK